MTGGKLSVVFYLYLPESMICLAQPIPYRLEITNLPYPLSFSALVRVTSFEFLEKLYGS